MVIPLATRPVLLTLVQALARGWPEDVSRDTLVALAFRPGRAEESPRARLRVELGRLRKLLRGVADIEATARGFVLKPLPAGGRGEPSLPSAWAGPLPIDELRPRFHTGGRADATRCSERSGPRALSCLPTRAVGRTGRGVQVA
jgi:hypothetical protein